MYTVTANTESTETRDIDAGELFRADARHLPVGALPAAERRIIAWAFILMQAIALVGYLRPAALPTVLGLCLAAGAAWTLVNVKPLNAAAALE